ncbi:NADP-dependent oxidoreductase domain-containing protein [Lentinula edodes]|uniref:NADP-dependent oxidoreductase domain-containing protein n=1 Tax=Lentinula lateritia TaxID=40482 RepID=A0A9W8ZNS8_9AGAR|nr:NADP-dependent oxidoreductase domain-containing protein [Lentinula edodes]
MPLEPIPLNDGNKIPSIAYGTGSKMKFQDITQYIEQAIETGSYQGSGLARSELFVTTKYFGEVPFRRVLERSSRKYSKMGWPSTVSIGVSNVVDVQQLENLIKFSRIKPAVNQVNPITSVQLSRHETIMDACAKHNIVVEAYSSLSPITTYPGGPVDVPLKAAAQRIGATPTQVVFLWVKAKGAVIVTTTTTKAHMEEYLPGVIAIDTAGAQGPPSDIVTKLRATSTKKRFLVALVVMMFGVYGLSMFGRMCQ